MAKKLIEEHEKLPEDMPIELQLDLLVDEELPEERRKALLRSLDKMPAAWRELSIRFLERQVERKSARQLISTGRVAAGGASAGNGTDVSAGKEIPATLPFPNRGIRTWWTPSHITGIAAGLLVVFGAGLVILHEYRPANRINLPMADSGAPGIRLVNTQLPSSVVGTEIPVQVSVVDMPRNSGATAFLPEGVDDVPGSRRSVVIQPDGNDNALVIPVRNLQVQ